MSDTPIVQCSSCKAAIFWGFTAKGKDCPYDAATVDDDAKNRVYVYMPDLAGQMQRAAHGHRSHFTTCANAQFHSRKAP